MTERLRIPALLFAFAVAAAPAMVAAKPVAAKPGAAKSTTAKHMRAKPMAMATLSPQAQGAEVQFVASATARLNALYPTTDAAEKAGYLRYNNEDSTGAISYANLQWITSDLDHPSQLWYDVNGRLLGADYSQPYTVNGVKAPAPTLWGLNPKRWFMYESHVHYTYKDATGAIVYGHAVHTPKYVAAGGNLADPQALPLTTITPVKDAASITHVFAFPDMWDVELWVVPNPLGAFAAKNPLVHPSKNARKGM